MGKKGFVHEAPVEGKTNVWLTPKYIIDALGPFDLDPCAATNRPFDIGRVNYTINDNGLSLPWEGYVFCNPPYGKETSVWADKMVEHNNGIFLAFARPDTKWAQKLMKCATAILFLARRVKFTTEDGTILGSPGAPSMLLAFGNHAYESLEGSDLKGVLFYRD